MAHLAEQDILRQLSELSKATNGKFWVAYSGGLDSQVLLSLALNAIPQSQLSAIHINHGLNPKADAWQTHCQQYCEAQGIYFECRVVEIDSSEGNLELQARKARYAEFESLLQENDYLLMAHHQDDQMETILYRLLRGSGPRGLSGIPAKRSLGRGVLLRPLLTYSKENLMEYATNSGLNWVEDDSNSNTDFDRNYLRQEIVPAIKQRWPGAGLSFQRSAELNSETDVLLRELAKADGGDFFNEAHTALPLEILQGKDHIRQRNILRYWFALLADTYLIPMPGYEELRRIVEEVIPAAEDAQPLVVWEHDDSQVQLRRYANKLYVLKDFPASINRSSFQIKPEESQELESNLGSIKLDYVTNGGVCFQEGDSLEICFDFSSSEAKPLGRKTRSFKKIFQDYGVPPWLRDRIPLLVINGKLAAVADLFVCHDMAAKNGEKQLQIHWQRADIHCGY
jgi:tRNA(Ile)-lysidine synthase